MRTRVAKLPRLAAPNWEWLSIFRDCEGRQAWHRGLKAEQTAGQRLVLVAGRIQSLGGGGGISRCETFAAKSDLGDIRHGKADGLKQVAFGRITAHAPTPEQAGPQTAVAVHRGSVRIAGTVLDLDKDPLVAQCAALPQIE